MKGKIFRFFDAAEAEKSPAYMLDWKAEKAKTDGIIKFIERILQLNSINRGAITKRAGMGNGQIKRILECQADKVIDETADKVIDETADKVIDETADKVIDETMAKRLAVTIVTLIPDLNKYEASRHQTRKITCPLAVCRIDDITQQESLREDFVKAFGNYGYYLAEGMTDINEAMEACKYYSNSYTNLKNK